jgi:hypothetical protein
MTLAQFAGQTVAGAAITDVWEAARGRFARFIGRGNADRTQAAERWLAETHREVSAAGPGLQQVQQRQAERWAGRFADLLDEDPSLEAGLRELAEETAAGLPARAVSATNHGVAAGRDVNFSGGIAGVIHGNVILPGPTMPGPA